MNDSINDSSNADLFFKKGSLSRKIPGHRKTLFHFVKNKKEVRQNTKQKPMAYANIPYGP